MKCVVTILQHKRVAMPYLFGTYSLPMMQERFNGEVKLFHIFHASNGLASHMTSNRVLGAERVEQVQQFIDSGHYANAIILNHTTTSDKWPTLPSLQLAAATALKEEADFHLWLEDDAIVYDEACSTWATALGSGDVGLFMDTNEKQMVNTAYFLSTREYDARFINMLAEYRGVNTELTTNKCDWDKYAGKGSLIEHLAWRAARKPIYLGPNKAFRHHQYQKFSKTGTDVRDWLVKHVPGISPLDLGLLQRDFDD